MLDKYATSVVAKLRVKRLVWPRAADPDFVQKMTRWQRRTPKLPSTAISRELDVNVTMVGDYPCVFLAPPDTSTKRILYIHGGAFVLPITNAHWRLAADLARQTRATVVVPLYPFVPGNTYKEIHAHILQVYRDLLTQASAGDISVIGDSAGGNLALVLPLLVTAKERPGKAVALSPVVDLSVSNPAIDQLETRDPLLPLDAIRHFLPEYYAERGAKDPIISPLFADYRGVKTRFYIMNGGKDLLSPDIELFHKKLADDGVDHEYLYAAHLPHAWPVLPLRAAGEARRILAEWCRA